MAAEQNMQKLRLELNGYHPSDIFNMDEAGLFFRALPNRSYLLPNEDDVRKVGRGVKAMKAKERLTIIMCANALGTCKIVPVVIRAAKTPRCFKNNPPSVPYYHQQNAWNDSKLYKKWDEVFVPTIRSFTKDPVALILDGF